MLESILKFNKTNFYQEKVRAIGKAVREYARLSYEQTDTEAISRAKEQAQHIISDIISESGVQERTYVALDREFFNEKGLLDEKSLQKFQREVVKHYGLQQLKWSFAGTTLNYSPITKRELKKQGIAYEELLPREMQTLKEKEKNAAYTRKDPGTYKAFLYSDGSVSERVIPERMQVRFDNLQDHSGFNWEGGYSPDNEVEKKDWITGFNKEGVWEKVMTPPAGKTYQPYHYSSRPVDHFTGSPVTVSGGRGEDCIGIIQGDDGVYLFDDYSFLYEDYEEFYYSITGEVYGAQKVDRDRSVKILKGILNKKGITALSGVVLRQASKKAVDHYKTILGDYVTKKTRFYSGNDHALTRKLSSMRTAIEGKEVSNRLIADVQYLTKRGIKNNELREILGKKPGSPPREVPLHIFEQESDLQTFLMLPSVQEVCDEETSAYLKDLAVPVEKQTILSNAVQNIISGFPEIFKHSPVKQIDVIRGAGDYLVHDKRSPVLEATVTAEESLFTVIEKASTLPGAGETFSAFIPVKNRDEYRDIFDEQERSEWITEELTPLFPGEITGAVKDALNTLVVPETVQEKFSHAVQNLFPLFPTIAESTGITPREMISHIHAVLLKKEGSEALQRKRIFFEKTIENVITESAKVSSPGIKKEEKEVSGGDVVRIEWSPFSEEINLFQDADRISFLESPILGESGFEPPEAEEVGEYIRSLVASEEASDIPVENQIEFSRGIINIIRGYKYQLKPRHISLKDSMKIVKDSVVKRAAPGDGEKVETHQNMRALVMNVAMGGKMETVKITQEQRKVPFPGETLPSLINAGLDAFLASRIITGGKIPREDAERVYHYLKTLSVPGKIKEKYSRAVISSLETYGNTFASSGVSALEAVKAVVLYVQGKANTIPSHLRKQVKELSETLSTPGSQTGTLPGGTPAMVPGTPGLEGLNLLSGDDFHTFVQSDLFLSSGLREDEVHSLIQEYRQVYNESKQQTRFYSSVPVAFSDDVYAEPPHIHGNIPPGLGVKPPGLGVKNTLFNVGFVLKSYPGQTPLLLLTQKGKKAVSHSHQGREAIVPHNDENIIQTQFAGMQQTTMGNSQEGDFPYSFAHLYSRKQNRTTPLFQTGGQKKTYHSPVQSSQQIKETFSGTTLPDTKKSTSGNQGLTHLQRIENNYTHDKKMLARSSSGSIQGKSSQEQQKSAKDDENVIKQLSDDLVEEMKNKARDEGF